MLGRRYETRRGKTDRKVSLQKSSSGSRLTIDTKNQERKPKLLFFVLFVKEKQSQEKKLGRGFRKENKERGIGILLKFNQNNQYSNWFKQTQTRWEGEFSCVSISITVSVRVFLGPSYPAGKNQAARGKACVMYVCA